MTHHSDSGTHVYYQQHTSSDASTGYTTDSGSPGSFQGVAVIYSPPVVVKQRYVLDERTPHEADERYKMEG